MALHRATLLLFLSTLALVNPLDEISSHSLLKGSVVCLDCQLGHDLSGIFVMVKCDKAKKFAVAYTGEDGTFQIELPWKNLKSSNPNECTAKIMGGPHQLYISSKTHATVIPKLAQESGEFTISMPLGFYQSCPSNTKCRAKGSGLGESKTVDLPLPGEWGLAPSSYYAYPFLPIIGIP